MRYKEKYIRPEIEIIEVCSEGIMQDPVSWEVGDKKEGEIIEGNPPASAKEYPGGNNNLWEDDEY